MEKELKNMEKKAFHTFDKTQKDIPEKGMKKSRSHTTNLRGAPDMDTSIEKEAHDPNDSLNTFDEKVSTANIDHPMKNAILRKALAIVN